MTTFTVSMVRPSLEVNFYTPGALQEYTAAIASLIGSTTRTVSDDGLTLNEVTEISAENTPAWLAARETFKVERDAENTRRDAEGITYTISIV